MKQSLTSTQTILSVCVYSHIDRTFDYLALNNPIPYKVGCRVLVPFGRRRLIGVIIDIKSHTTIDPNKLKSILNIIDQEPIFDEQHWQWLLWASNYYQQPIADVLFTALPTWLREGKQLEACNLSYKHIYITNEGKNKLKNATWIKRATTQAPALIYIEQFGEQGLDESKLKQYSSTTLLQLQKKSLITIKDMSVDTDKQYFEKPNNITLTDEQNQAITIIEKRDHFNVDVLFGITGSGKTEIYLRRIHQILSQNKQVLWLEPEIGITPQMLAQVENRFQVPIITLHSRMSDKKRAQAWYLAKTINTACILIGTRSAVFAPLQNCGLIIIDEEHDSSYQQQTRWRYCARDLAIMRAKMLDVPIILGSATPSLSTIANIEKGRYQCVELNKRVHNVALPKWNIIDIKDKKLNAGLCDESIDIIASTLKNNKQVLVFLNRRGFSQILICHHCGWIQPCNRCDANLVWHANKNKAICHHCGFSQNKIRICPACKQSETSQCGIGTEQIENYLIEKFSQYSIVRIDRDSVTTAKDFNQALDHIAQEQAMVLVGTQMLAKGHHFKSLDTVIIVDIDGAFFSPYYHSIEMIGQLCIQVAGRAGREKQQGTVILQTRHPENPLLNTLINDGYKHFAKLLLSDRQHTNLPPYAFINHFIVESTHANKAMQSLHELKNHIKSFCQQTNTTIAGPIPCLLAKRAGKFRFEIIIICPSKSIRHQVLSNARQHINSKKPSATKIHFHVV